MGIASEMGVNHRGTVDEYSDFGRAVSPQFALVHELNNQLTGKLTTILWLGARCLPRFLIISKSNIYFSLKRVGSL